MNGKQKSVRSLTEPSEEPTIPRNCSGDCEPRHAKDIMEKKQNKQKNKNSNFQKRRWRSRGGESSVGADHNHLIMLFL